MTNFEIEPKKVINQWVSMRTKRIIDRLTRRSEQIACFPLSGRRVPEFERDQIREVIEGAYRIIYQIKPDQIDVLAILYAAANILSS